MSTLARIGLLILALTAIQIVLVLILPSSLPSEMIDGIAYILQFISFTSLFLPLETIGQAIVFITAFWIAIITFDVINWALKRSGQ